MDNYLLNLVVNILLMIFAIFSVIDLIYDKSREGSFLKKINKRGWILVFIALLSIGFNLFKDWKADSKNKVAEKDKAKGDSLLHESQKEILQLQLNIKSAIIEKVDSTYIKSIKASNEALAKYNLQITDSLNSVVSKLKLNAVNPQLLIKPLEMGKQSAYVIGKYGEKELKIQYISKGGTCYNIQLSCYFLKEISNSQDSIIYFDRPLTGKNFLTEDVIRTIKVKLISDILLETKIFVYLTGTFTKDPQGKIKVPYNEAFNYNFKENIFITKISVDYEGLKKLLSTYHSVK